MIEYHKPKYVILENVRNLSTHDKGHTWNVIRNRLDELNYNTYAKPLILNTLYFDVPQSRERVVILCKRKDLGDLPECPECPEYPRVRGSSGGRRCTSRHRVHLESILEPDDTMCGSKYLIQGKTLAARDVWNAFVHTCQENRIDIPRFPIWTDWWDGDGIGTSVTRVSKRENETEMTEAQRSEIIKKAQVAFYAKYTNWIDKNRAFYEAHKDVLGPWLMRSRRDPLWKGALRKMEWQTGENSLDLHGTLWSTRGSGVRVKNTDYAPTLVAMTSMLPIYGPKSRVLTPRECARLQSFPDTYKLHEDDRVAYRQFGNAVNVKMIERSARFLILNESLFEDHTVV